MNFLMLLTLCFLTGNVSQAGVDFRKSPESMKAAKEAAQFIIKEGKKWPPGADKMALNELKKVCSDSLHKGCYFWDNRGKIMFQPLNNNGEKDGKISDLDGWLTRLFHGKKN